jgi:non-specific serine/threonine protein kinase
MSKNKKPESSGVFLSFGEMMRYLRERLHLSQRELAGRVSYHHSYISYIEKNMRIPDEDTLTSRFIPALQLENEPELTDQFLALAKKQVENPTSKETSIASNAGMPVLKLAGTAVSILGRDSETSAIIKMFQNPDIRLLTIIGPPGVGKTRLAVKIAEEMHYNNGLNSFFVSLSPVTQPELLLSTIASTLGMENKSAEDISEALKNKSVLVVLDNFEQIIGSAPQLMPLLASGPNVKILATSREALRIRGEQEFLLSPFQIDNSINIENPAVQLFIERAQLVKPDMVIDAKSVAEIAEICKRLDGLPLAIELAAARCENISLQDILEQVNSRFEWLIRDSHDIPEWRRTLWGAIDWSYATLTESEQTLLARLAVFSGGWTIESAEMVCSDTTLCLRSNILNLLLQLADKSLLTIDPEQNRFGFLETLREFSNKKLGERGELELLRKKHYEYFLSFAQTAKAHIFQGALQIVWLQKMENEHNNLRAALTWVTEDPSRGNTAMDFANAIHIFWMTRSHISEARRWLEKILGMDSTPTPLRANLLRFASDYASTQGDYEKAAILEEQAMEISKSLGDEAGIIYSMEGLAVTAGIQGNFSRAVELLEQAVEFRRKTNDNFFLCSTLNNLGTATRKLGNLGQAEDIYIEVIRLARPINNIKSISHALNGLAEINLTRKSYKEAVALHRESIMIRNDLGDRKGLANSLKSLSFCFFEMENYAIATEMISASFKLREQLGFAVTASTVEEEREFISQLGQKLGENKYSHHHERGNSLSINEIISITREASPNNFSI